MNIVYFFDLALYHHGILFYLVVTWRVWSQTSESQPENASAPPLVSV